MKLKIYSYKSVKSTNDTAIRLIKQNIKQGIVTSDIQTNGKGQRGKKWVSRRGNLFISIFFPSSNIIAAQPPLPGFSIQEPSVYILIINLSNLYRFLNYYVLLIFDNTL